MTTSRQRTLSRDQIHQTLWRLTAKQLDKDPTTLRPDSRVLQDLGADSLDVAELGMALEEELDVALPDEALGNPSLTLGEVEQAVWDVYARTLSGGPEGRR